MLNKKELLIIITLAIVLSFVISLVESWEIFLYTLLSVLLIFMINITTKKVVSFYLDTEIEIKLWEISRYGWTAGQHFRKALPAGALIPLIVKVFSMGYLNWMACFVFDAKSKIYRAAKRHGLYSFSEINESHLGVIAASGIFMNLIFAMVGYFIGLPEPMNFVKLSMWFALFNMLPISDLDGNKVFFGNLVLWSVLASIVLVGLIYSIFVI